MAVIKSVDASSPAERAGVRAGDELLSIGGHAVRDVLDYKFYGYDAKLDVVVSAHTISKSTRGRSLASILKATSSTRRGAAQISASSALSIRCRRICVIRSISRMTTRACPSSWATISR